MTQFKVRDRRANRRYFVDNALLRGGWGAKIGPYGIAVYNAIAMHADADAQSGYPSHELIAKLTGMSRPTVIKSVSNLEKWKIVEISRRNGRVHTYYLTDQSEWEPVNVVDTPVNVVDTPVNQVDTNKTQETKQKEQNPIIGADAQNDNGAKEQKPPTQAQLCFSALVEVCGYDLGLLTGKDRGKLNVVGKKLRDAGVVAGDIQDFGVYWRTKDWRGQKGQHPDPNQVRSEWGRYKAWRGDNGRQPKLSAAGTHGPVACAAGLGDVITADDFTDEELGRCST